MMAASLDNKSYYDEFSGWYERERGRGYHALIDRLELDIALPLAEGCRVLEAGCGTGLILQALTRAADHAVGADLSAGMLRGSADKGLPVAQADLTNLPFADDSFDFVCSFKVLAHVPPIREALAELVRVTRPGGKLALEFYNPWSLRYLAKRIRPAHISATIKEDAVFTRWDSVGEMLEMAPAGTSVDAVHGVRVFTPFAQVHKVPLLRSVVGALERWAVDSPLRWLGGFIVVVLTKDPA